MNLSLSKYPDSSGTPSSTPVLGPLELWSYSYTYSHHGGLTQFPFIRPVEETDEFRREVRKGEPRPGEVYLLDLWTLGYGKPKINLS